MRKIASLMLGLCLLSAQTLLAQTYKGKTEIGIQAGGIFFEGNSMLDEDGVYGGRIGYNFTEHWSAELGALAGRTEVQVESANGGNAINTTAPSAMADLFIPTIELQYNFGQSRLRPYVGAGVGDLHTKATSSINQYGGSSSKSDDFIVQYGAGLKWSFANHLLARIDARHMINTESGYQRFGTSHNNATITGGLSWIFGGCGDACAAPKKEAAPVAAVAAVPVVAAPVDTDGDSVIDTQDACPGTPAGTKVDVRGCALPVDSDGDGVTDDKDECANTPAGTAVDAAGCPQQAQAVPVDNWVLGGVQFETGSDKLKSESKTALDEAADILTTRTRVRVEIQGHSDSTGKAESNMVLSQKRADSVKAYLVAKGVTADRLESKGYGSTVPVGDNATSTGRAANRRIAFKVLSR